MTADHIDFHAHERPGAIALIVDGRAVTYAEFSRDIRKFAGAMRGFALPQDSVVAVACGDNYVHWLLLQAFERLGIATASLSPDSPLTARRCAEMGLVLSEPRFRVGSPRRHQTITPEWVRSILAHTSDDGGGAIVAPETTVRITWTSGTTGTPKKLIFSHRLFAAWGAKWTWLWSLTHQSRCLVTMPFSVGGVYACIAGCLCAGATVVHETRTTLAEALVTQGVTHMLLLPIQLRKILADLPPDSPKPASLTIASFGAGLSDALRERALARLATEVCDMYGANEVDWVCVTSKAGTEGVKTLIPGVHAEVVDDRDVPLPEGAMGRLRVKTARMVDGYADNPEATRNMFKGGWFYPGDLAVLRGGRLLQIVGRGDELLNVGGQKFAPAMIEDRIRETIPLGDVGVCSRRNEDGIEQICVAVSGATMADDELLNRLNKIFLRFQVGDFLVTRMDEIPRNATGKVLRDRLRESFAACVPLSRGT